MKKLIAITLTLVIVLSLTCSVLATNEYTGTETNISIYTPDSFSSLFSASSISQLAYNYSFVLCDDHIANVELDITLVVGNSTYTGSASGIVSGNQVNAVDYIWEGSLEGAIMVQDEMLINVGFSKHNSTNDVQLCCTIQPTNVSSGDIVAFSAGSISLQQEITNAKIRKFIDSGIQEDNTILSLNNGISPASFGGGDIVQEPGTDLGGSIYAYKGSQSVGFQNSPYSGIGCRTAAYFAPTLNRVAVCSIPYADNISNYYNSVH